jgi:SAM-dependent methyltransferase
MPPQLRFRHQSKSHQLGWGEYFALPRELGFRDTAATDLTAITAEIVSGRAWRNVIDDRFASSKPWLHSIITSPKRTAFLGSVLPPGDGVVLDVGAGWGQLSRPLAKERPVVALEPVAERLAFIRAAARQDGIANQLAFVEADYLDLEFETPFSAICAIGVLEWVGAFQTEMDPQERQRQFLQKARRELATGGHLILGIENRIGLKYLLGCPDDHLGVPGIACLPAPLAKARWASENGQPLASFTYSQAELQGLLTDAGFRHIDFFGAFPDYKLPEKIVPLASGGAALNAWLSQEIPPTEHNGYNGEALSADFGDALNAHYRTLAQESAAHPFVPSFFVRAS